MQTTPSYYTWDMLATVGGATAVTLIIVQYLKAPLDKVWKIPTRLLVWVIGFLLLLCADAVTGGISLKNIPLLIVNAFVVALAAMGAYEHTFSSSDQQKKEKGTPGGDS